MVGGPLGKQEASEVQRKVMGVTPEAGRTGFLWKTRWSAALKSESRAIAQPLVEAP